jgi:hypothetical protein
MGEKKQIHKNCYSIMDLINLQQPKKFDFRQKLRKGNQICYFYQTNCNDFFFYDNTIKLNISFIIYEHHMI